MTGTSTTLQLRKMLSSLWHDLLNFFYPRTCAACRKALTADEACLCLKCRFTLPKTNYHLEKENAIEKIFWGRIPLAGAASYYFFRKGGKVQRLVHAIKYDGRKEVAVEAGRWYGTELRKSEFADTLDSIVPVPLHKSKERRRGFNQSEYFGRGLSQTLHLPLITEKLVRVKATETQTRKSRYERWLNVSTVFQVEDETLQGQHVLLIDDVVTTGATLEASAQALFSAGVEQVSIVTLACAT